MGSDNMITTKISMPESINLQPDEETNTVQMTKDGIIKVIIENVDQIAEIVKRLNSAGVLVHYVDSNNDIQFWKPENKNIL